MFFLSKNSFFSSLETLSLHTLCGNKKTMWELKRRVTEMSIYSLEGNAMFFSFFFISTFVTIVMMQFDFHSDDNLCAFFFSSFYYVVALCSLNLTRSTLLPWPFFYCFWICVTWTTEIVISSFCRVYFVLQINYTFLLCCAFSRMKENWNWVIDVAFQGNLHLKFATQLICARNFKFSMIVHFICEWNCSEF